MLTILTIACPPAPAGTILRNFNALSEPPFLKTATQESEAVSADSLSPSAPQSQIVAIDLRRASDDPIDSEPVAVPEPPSFALPGLALIGIASLSRHLRKRSS